MDQRRKNKIKYTTFANLYVALYWIISSMIVSFVFAFFDRKWPTMLFVFLVSQSFFIICALCIFPRVFSVVTLTKKGISNRFVTVSWNDINRYGIFEFNPLQGRITFPFRKPVFPDMLYIGDLYRKDLMFQYSRKTIFLALTAKNLALLKKTNDGKSPAINEVLNLYLREIPQKRKFGD